MNLRCLLGLWVFGCLGISAHAATWVVSPSGAGNGTTNDPGSLAVALAHTGWAANIAIDGSDTIYLRAGIHLPTEANYLFTFGAGGITIRNFPGEVAKVDGRWRFGNHGYNSIIGTATDTEPFGLHCYDSHEYEQFLFGGIGRGYALFDDNSSLGNTWLNVWVHDAALAWGGNAAGDEVSGCLVTGIGQAVQDHAWYPAPLRLFNNIGFFNTSNVEGGSPGIIIASNIFAATSEALSAPYRDILLGSSGHVLNNAIFQRTFGVQAMAVAGNVTLRIAGNTVAAHSPLVISSGGGAVIVTNNTFFMPTALTNYAVLSRASSSGAWVFEHNDYCSRAVPNFEDVGVPRTFSNWRDTNPTFDLLSTSATAEPVDSVKVFSVGTKRAHVAIFNYSESPNVVVNLAGILSTGDTYKIWSAQNYGAGAIRTGVFVGVISFPMTNLSAAAFLYATNTVQPTVTSPEFAAFIVTGSAGLSGGSFEITGNATLNGNGNLAIQ